MYLMSAFALYMYLTSDRYCTCTVEPPNNGHSGVSCREVVPISEGTERMLLLVGGKQFVRSTEVVRFTVRTIHS